MIHDPWPVRTKSVVDICWISENPLVAEEHSHSCVYTVVLVIVGDTTGVVATSPYGRNMLCRDHVSGWFGVFVDAISIIHYIISARIVFKTTA